MFVQQIIILSHKTYKLAHESQTRQNDYPNFVQILAAGVFNYKHSVWWPCNEVAFHLQLIQFSEESKPSERQ